MSTGSSISYRAASNSDSLSPFFLVSNCRRGKGNQTHDDNPLRHCERSEAIQRGLRSSWIASLRSQRRAYEETLMHVDSHCHLNYKGLAEQEEAVLARPDENTYENKEQTRT